MSRLLTGYAHAYNRRNHRHGHLFQNRYKSILCEEEPYFLKLVSYIHLNPLRPGLVSSLEMLNGYPWSGHAVLMNRNGHGWQDREYVLGYFGKREGAAQKAYLEFVQEQMTLGRQPELTGGGLIRSAGGWSEVLSMKKRGEKQFSDERILGSGECVKELLDEAEEKVTASVPVFSRIDDAGMVLEQRCEATGISVLALKKGSKRRELALVRTELAVRFVVEYCLSYADAARILGTSASTVNQIFRRHA